VSDKTLLVVISALQGFGSLGENSGYVGPSKCLIDLMGSPESEEGRSDRETQHAVSISRGFSLGSTEVTQGLYASVMRKNPSHFSSCGDDCPVENVSWYNAVKFANALSKREGLEECHRVSGKTVTWPRGLDCRGYRLPTEAEWEYAARGGEDTLYSGTNDVKAAGWTISNAGGKTHAVGGKAENAWGLYDMTGNVYEWVWDWYQSDYQSDISVDPVGPQSGSRRVYRGGSWFYTPRFARVSYRYRFSPTTAINNLGFRLARTDP